MSLLLNGNNVMSRFFMLTKTTLAGVLILSVPVLPSAGQSVDIQSLKLDWKHFELPNGLQVVMQQDLNRGDVSVEFWLDAGAGDEKPGHYGLAHFFEHATPYGLRDDGPARKKLLENMNFSNAQTRMDYIRYYIQVNPEVLEEALHYVSDRLTAGPEAITDEWVERHRKNVLAEYDRQAKSPFWGGDQRAMRYAGTFGSDHPYGHSPYGSRRDNENFGTDDFRGWYEKHLHAGNITLFIVGKFDLKEGEKLVRKYLESVPSKKGSKRTATVAAAHASRTETVRISSESSHAMILTWAIPGWGAGDDPAMRLAADILERRLAAEGKAHDSISEAGSGIFVYRSAGEFLLYALFESAEDSTKAENLLKAHRGKLLELEVSQDELRTARAEEFESVRSKIENERLGFIDSRTELLGEGILFAGDPDFYLKRLEKQQDLTARAILDAARKWLGSEPFRLLVITAEAESENEK